MVKKVMLNKEISKVEQKAAGSWQEKQKAEKAK